VPYVSTAVDTSTPTTVQTMFGLTYPGANYDFPNSGNVKWLLSNNGSNSGLPQGFFFIKTNGTIHAWDGVSAATSTPNPVVAQVNPLFWLDPDLLVTANLAQMAYTTQQTLALIKDPKASPGNPYDVGPAGVPFLVSNNNSNPAGQNFYFINPDGTVYKYDGNSVATSTTPGNKITTLNASYFRNPALLSGAIPPLLPPAGITATHNNDTLTSTNIVIDGYQDFTGTFGVVLSVDDGVQTTYSPFVVTVTDSTLSLGAPTLTPASSTSPPAVPTATVVHTSGTGAGVTALFTTTDPDVPPSPTTFTYNASVVTEAAAIDELFALSQDPATFNYDFPNSANVKWFFSNNNSNPLGQNFYFIKPDGTFYKYNGSSVATSPLVATLPATFWSNPDSLATADTIQTAYSQANVLDLVLSGFNALGFQEEKFTSMNNSNPANGNVYYLLPDGELHQADGSLNPTTMPLVARLSVTYWNNPALLTGLVGAPASATVAAMLPPGLTVATATTGSSSNGGTTVTVMNYQGFVGTFGISTTVSDGLATAAADFLVTTTDSALVLANPGPQVASQGGSPQAQVALNGSDPDVPATSAALKYRAATGVYADANAALAAAVMQALNLKFLGTAFNGSRGYNEEYFQSATNNDYGNPFYILTPDGKLRPLSSTSGGGSMNPALNPNLLSAPVIAQFPAAYYSTPSMLTSPATTTAATSSVSGNVVTYNGFAPGDVLKSVWGAAFVTEVGGPLNSIAFVTYQINVGP
jgi:hypothetical protein